ncbi:MAG: polysaccharide lyase family 8 super-sandwich domain-containing protein [Verrucomicrobiae bacterium]|nr:polysaccharide lyase family 8 super-sandwich domain-containing protein [Verrucomicrobiae bacterium]
MSNCGLADDFALLRQAWGNYLTGGTNLNLSDPNVSAWVANVGNTASGNWTSMNKAANRTYLWSNASSWSTNSANITTCYYRLSTMAQGYNTKGSSVYNNAAMAADIVSAMGWMYTNVYNEHITQYNNWWDWEIGAPNDLNSCMVLMYPLLSGAQITNYCNAIDHFTPSGFGTGANRGWFSEVMAVRGVVGLSSNRVSVARDILSDVTGGGANNVFAYVSTNDGFYRDGSFIQHEHDPYTGGYGSALLQVLSKMTVWLAPSQWAVTDPWQTNMVQWCYNSFQPLIYYGLMPDDVRGRGISGSTDGYTVGEGAIDSIFRIAQTAPTNDAARLSSMVKYWGQVNPDASLTSYMDVDLMPAAEQLLTNVSVTARGELVGHYRFPAMDRVMHLVSGFGFTLSMFSSRIYNYEFINSDNYHGWFTGYGMNYLYSTNDWFQFTDNYWPTVDPYHLPGTTVNQTLVSNGTNGNMAGSQNWVGGTSLSAASGVTVGVTGMALADVDSSLVARKSWFMFNNEIVCLGAGITCGSGSNVDTTVENRKISTSNTNTFVADGKVMPTTLGWSSNMLNVRWCDLDASGGYYFPGGANITARRQARTGTWAAIGAGGSSTAYTRNYLTLIWSHGVNPTNSTYAYVLLPNSTATGISNYASNPTAIILTNSPMVQAASEPALGIVAANFWTNAVQTVGAITVSNQCSVITCMSGDVLEVDVSDPTWTNTRPINLSLQTPCLGLISASSGVSVLQLNPLKLSVNVSGAHGQTFQARLQLADAPLITLTNNDAFGATSFNAAGNWSNGQAPASANNYGTTGFWVLRTPADGNSYTFGGNSLTLGGPAGFANNWNLSTKQSSSAAVLTFNNLILTNYGVLHNTGTGGSQIGLAGNLTVANGGGALSPGDGNIVVYSTVTGAGPLWIGDPVAACSYGVIFSGSFTNFTGNIYATNMGAQASAAPAMLVFSNNADQVYAGNIVFMNSSTFTNAVAKQGTGKLTLTGRSTYAGATSVRAGTLSINGSLSTGPVLVAADATLGGNGLIGGSVIVNNGGTLAPGMGGTGTLTIGGRLALSGNLFFKLNKASSQSNDYAAVSGTLSNTGTGALTVTNLGPALVAGDRFILFNQPVSNGSALAIVPSDGVTFSNNLSADGSIQVLTVPIVTASNPTNIMVNVSGNILDLSWPVDHVGWRLQSTPALANSNWQDVAGSTGTNQVAVPVNVTNQAMFFRLVHP